MRDIDDLSMELTKAAFNSDKLPPKLRYRIQRWLSDLKRDGHTTETKKSEFKQFVKAELIKLIAQATEPVLAKNEVMASSFSDGSIKLDFGSGIPAHVKKAALSWAKKRGLKPIEASLDKSITSASFIVLSKSEFKGGQCINKVKWALPL